MAPARRSQSTIPGQNSLRPFRALALLGTTATVLFGTSSVTTFVSSNCSTVSSRVARRAAGFTEEPEVLQREKKVKGATASISPEQLKQDHGDKWEMVDDILKGKKAASPEAIMRARYTALKFKDPQFLAATEQDEIEPIKKRAEKWAVLLGLKEKSFWDNILNFGKNIEALQEPVGFQVIFADEDDVEFKIRCKNGKTLHEKSRFAQDRKWGYVYTGNSLFTNWE
jgi:uncharacterized protein YchJ